MTPEELHEARKAEAVRLTTQDGFRPDFRNWLLDTYARLVREDWRPADPDLIEARKLCAKMWPAGAADYLGGKADCGPPVQACLDGIKRGRELERGE